MKTKKNILIIKLGYCETLVNEFGFTPSLGDVFRHTVMLHHLADRRVTWLTSESVFPLLDNNPFIHELLIYRDGKTNPELATRTFDTVLNLEKAPSLCALARSIPSAEHLGFGWDGEAVQAHPLSQRALDIANGKQRPAFIQSVLYEMMGAQWKGEDYVLGYVPRSAVVHDIGLNFLVGSKWPSKAWPQEHWQELARRCKAAGWSVSWQQGSTDLYEYMDWIHSSRLVVTCDSLGMHVGLAMKKKVVALFGPTPSDQIFMYGRGVIVRAHHACKQSPCMAPECSNSPCCMDQIEPVVILEKIRNLLEVQRIRPVLPRRRRLTRAPRLEESPVPCR